MTLSELHQKCIESGKYPLFPGATRLVPGHGNPRAEIMFIGEAPGADEDKNGIPFVGRAGRFLDELLESIGVVRADVYITNMVKCRPPNNRDPEEDELELYKAWLDWEIKLIQPKVFVPLGRFALSKFLPGVKISEVHGKAFRRGEMIFFAMYHPAAALYNGGMRQTLFDDMSELRRVLDGDFTRVEVLEERVSETVAEIKELLNKPKDKDKKEGPPEAGPLPLF